MATSWWSDPRDSSYDGEGAPEVGFGLGETVRVEEQQGQVVEGNADVWVVGSESFLVDGESAAEEGLGFGEAVGGLEQ